MSDQFTAPSLSIQRHEDYLTANLLDFFRTIDNENKWMQAEKIALNHVQRVASRTLDCFEKKFSFLAHRLKNNITPTSLRAFAHECIVFAQQREVLSRTPSSQKTQTKNIEKKIQKKLSLALDSGCSQGSAVNRVAHSLLLEKVEQRRLIARSKLIEQHPLGTTLNLLAGNQKIAKEDIRNHLFNLAKKSNNKGGTQLFNILKKAQSFSVINLHSLLGDELFFLCRPLGFLDQKSEIVIV
ncbi:MAG: hypothetical protein KC505_08320, partial [Myxococcales bacterium]|nr:hypothetical protein [Myxococcales bacterium]